MRVLTEGCPIAPILPPRMATDLGGARQTVRLNLCLDYPEQVRCRASCLTFGHAAEADREPPMRMCGALVDLGSTQIGQHKLLLLPMTIKHLSHCREGSGFGVSISKQKTVAVELDAL